MGVTEETSGDILPSDKKHKETVKEKTAKKSSAPVFFLLFLYHQTSWEIPKIGGRLGSLVTATRLKVFFPFHFYFFLFLFFGQNKKAAILQHFNHSTASLCLQNIDDRLVINLNGWATLRWLRLTWLYVVKCKWAGQPMTLCFKENQLHTKWGQD